MAIIFVNHNGVMDKAMNCHANDSWFEFQPGAIKDLKVYYTFRETLKKFYFLKKLFFTIKNYRFSNTFWLYQYGVRNAHRQSYTHLKSEILIWVTLYIVFDN